ncbi:hypothetical protein NV377_16790 [Paenibacillus sp. T3-5-0-4]|nr:hypothetical protein [Paenibacillus endoradicis]
MATISTYIKMMDQFSKPIKSVRDKVNKTVVVMGKLRTAVERPAKLNINTTNAHNKLSVIQDMIQGTKININFNATEAVHKARLLKDLLQKQLIDIKAYIRVELPASLTVLFTNLQRLVLKLIASTRRMQGSVGDNSQKACCDTDQDKNPVSKFKDLFDGLNQMFQPIKSIFGGMNKMLQPVRSIFGGMNKMLQPVRNLFSGMSKMLQPVRNVFGGMNKMLQPVRSIFGSLNRMLQPVRTTFGGLIKTLQAAKSILSSGFKTMFQGVKSKLSGALPKLLPGKSGSFLMEQVAKPLVSTSIGGAMKQQQTEDMFIAKTGSAEMGKGMFEKFKSEALAAGQDVNQTLQSSLSFLPEVQNVDQISQLNELSQRMAAFDISGNGIEGAASALKEALNGDASSLANSLKMSPADMSSFKIEDLAQSGNVDGLISAFDQMLEKQNMGKDAFATMMASPIKQVETLKGNLNSALADSGQQAVTAFMPLITMLNTAFQEGKFQPFFDLISGGLALVASVAAWAGQLIVDNIDTVINILIALGIIALVVGASMLISWIMAVWPILLLIGVIVGLISLLNYFGVSTEQIVGFVGGLFMALVAFIWNPIALLWNMIVSFAEFLINVFIDPIYSIKKLIYDLAMEFGGFMYNMILSAEDFAGSFMSTILSAINGVLGGFNKLSAGILKLTGIDLGQVALFDETNVNAISDGFKNIMDQMQEPVKTKGTVDFSGGKASQLNMSDQFDKGFDVTSNAFSGVGDALGKSTDFSSFGNDPSKSSMSNIGGMGDINSVGEVGEVGKINDTVDISSEDLKMMRELAEMKNIQNYVSLTPSVSFGDTHVRNESDINTIVSKITQKLEQDIASSANAVYG